MTGVSAMADNRPGFFKLVLWRLTRAVSERGRRWSWDRQFLSGRYDYIRVKDQEIVHRVEKWARGGKLVELACGGGGLPGAVKPGTFSEYLGIDISSVAIERARAKKIPNCRFEVGDLESWPGEKGASMITIEECIFYLPHAKQERLLNIALECVGDKGVVL